MRKEFAKALFYFLAMFMVSLTAVAQDENEEAIEMAPEVVIDMDFNKSLFTNNFGNMFMSETPKAVLIAMVIPQSYESGKVELAKAMGADLTKSKSSEFVEDGIKYFTFSGFMMQDGVEIFAEAFIKKIEANSCIMITSMYEPSIKEKFGKEAKRAIISAKVVE